MNPSATATPSEGLRVLNERLDGHFRALRLERDRLAEGKPVFALEHGLSDGERALLDAEVRMAVERGEFSPELSLPIVIYATELGYEYSGDEYWDTFVARTPGWPRQGSRNSTARRHYVRDQFAAFSAGFGGIKPGGAWARQFSIICWPITHAVLPSDLQRQLARLLFEFRTGLTSDLLSQPDELGRRLAARAWDASSRFRQFVAHTELLGQVAAALLAGEDEESPYLLGVTLGRIVTDLSRERESRSWLRDARSRASQVRTRGLRRPGSPSRTQGGADVRLPAASDPGLQLCRIEGAWSVFLELPDLSSLAERLPTLHEELARSRCRVAGVEGPPLATGLLLRPGQRRALDSWPSADEPFLSIENGSMQLARLLADQCIFPIGPPWLFWTREPSLAVEVRGKFVRPGREYVLITTAPLESDLPGWMKPTACSTPGVHAVALDLPSTLAAEDLDQLRILGLRAVIDVNAAPLGLVPADWDGEGAGEWLAGEEPVVTIRTARETKQCIVAVDGVPEILDWPKAAGEIFLAFSELAAGTHTVEVTLVPPESDDPVAEGEMTIVIRDPHRQVSSGTFREGLLVLAHPPNPTLDELSDGRAQIEVIGPQGVRAQFRIELGSRRAGDVLLSRSFAAELPMRPGHWRRHFSAQMRGAEARRASVDAETCTLTVGHPELGTRVLRIEREFVPLRWAVADSEGTVVRLIDNTDGQRTTVVRYECSDPQKAIPVTFEADPLVRASVGDLIVAEADGPIASIILPPIVRDLVDLQRASVTPRIDLGPKAVRAIERAVSVARLWGQASPTNLLAELPQRAVLVAVTQTLNGLIGGGRWAGIEHRIATLEAGQGSFAPVSINDMAEAIGTDRYQRVLAAELSGTVEFSRQLEPEQRVEEFARLLATCAVPAGVRGEDPGLAEFLLRLASSPPTVDASVFIRDPRIPELTMASPVLLRAARFLVLAVHFIEGEESTALYRGWQWSSNA